MTAGRTFKKLVPLVAFGKGSRRLGDKVGRDFLLYPFAYLLNFGTYTKVNLTM